MNGLLDKSGTSTMLSEQIVLQSPTNDRLLDNSKEAPNGPDERENVVRLVLLSSGR